MTNMFLNTKKTWRIAPRCNPISLRLGSSLTMFVLVPFRSAKVSPPSVILPEKNILCILPNHEVKIFMSIKIMLYTDQGYKKGF